MSRKYCVLIGGSALLLSALLDNMPAWAQPTYGFQRDQHFMAAGEVFRDCPSCPEMVVLPAGIFTMGSRDKRSRYHPVTIAQPFAVGRYEVTFAEWDACVAQGGCKGYQPADNNWGRDRRPVINVSWEDVQDYLYWLDRKTGESYRLLSEAEWEYAVRAGTTADNYWGDSASSEICAYANVSGQRFACAQGEREVTAPVGSFRPNPFGLYDMIGNVQEWTADCWNYTYDGAPADGSAWRQGDCSWRVTRGVRTTKETSRMIPPRVFRSRPMSERVSLAFGWRGRQPWPREGLATTSTEAQPKVAKEGRPSQSATSFATVQIARRWSSCPAVSS